MALISLIHPSRGRAQKSWETTREWIAKAGAETELIVAIDDDDPQREAYLRQYSHADLFMTKIVSNPNDCVVQAVNNAAVEAHGDILVYLSDDFKCPHNWGADIIEMSKNWGKWMLKVDDGYQKFNNEVLTIPIMSRSLYEDLGYFFHPAYKSMWVDVDLYFTCRNMGVIMEAPHMKFPHHHYCNGKAQKDETYARSDRHMETGRAIHNERKRLGYPR